MASECAVRPLVRWLRKELSETSIKLQRMGLITAIKEPEVSDMAIGAMSIRVNLPPKASSASWQTLSDDIEISRASNASGPLLPENSGNGFKPWRARSTDSIPTWRKQDCQLHGHA